MFKASAFCVDANAQTVEEADNNIWSLLAAARRI